MEFLVTKFDKGNFAFGFNIERESSVGKQYPWHKDGKQQGRAHWSIQLSLFVVEITWNFIGKVFETKERES